MALKIILYVYISFGLYLTFITGGELMSKYWKETKLQTILILPICITAAPIAYAYGLVKKIMEDKK